MTAVPKDNAAIVTINGIVTAAGLGRSVALGSPGSITTILIVVETLNGLETTYTVTVTRLLSSDNNLSALTVTQGALNPNPFNADTLDYTVDVATNVTSVTVTATKSDPNAVISGSLTAGAGVATGQATIALGGQGTATPVTITATAPNGSAKTYNITVNRLSNDNNLSALSVTPGSLDPAFAANTLPYTVNVAIDIAEVTVTATKSDPNAVLSGSITDPGAGQATGQATIPLGGPGTATPVSITVTSPNGNSKTYTITVNRAAPSSDNNLSALSLTPGSLDPAFAANTLSYTVNVATTVTSVDVSATKADADAVMSGDVTAGTGVPTGQATVPLIPLLPRTVSITVTAPNGDSKIYSVTITRAFP
ncbi:MAG: cadherin-like beta sandwich domain-containing protein [Nitrospira sp.]|nr:MAG: cadherin-like beta sandwich domain-containing protein [Nitrospira sp.]